MIARIEGQLLELMQDLALVRVGSVTYEVMLPGYCVSALSGRIGQEVTLCTMEYYEGTLGGGNLIPRMIGFLNFEERAFFTRFTSVKGLGVKKGLKALSMPIADIASAIELADEKLLCVLPSIGKRMAQQIIAELQGKVQRFAAASQPAPGKRQLLSKPFQVEALEILVAWGEKRNEAQELIELACRQHPDIQTAEALIPLVYRVKQGIEV